MEREDTLHFPLDKVKIKGIKVVERLMLVTNAAEFFPVSFRSLVDIFQELEFQ